MTDRPIEKRPYQERIITKTIDAFTVEECKSVLIEAPTGSGKTFCGLKVLKQLENNFGMTFGWVAMRRKLLQQAQEENERIGVNRIHFISMFDKNPPKFDLMLVDECHHDAAATCATLHKLTGAELSLGLTATPMRTDRVKLAYERVISDCGIRFLVEQGYLSPYEQYVIPEYTPEVIAKRFIPEKEKWGKSIIFLKTQDLCCDLNKRLLDAGVKSEIIMGSTPHEEQDNILQRFDEGETQVLVNIYMLTEGFDSPNLRTVWCRDSGRLCVSQMAGRSLRKDPSNPLKIANIVQSNETRWPFPKTARPKKEYVWADDDSGWRGLEPGPQVDLISQAVRDRLLVKPVNLPTFLFLGANKISMNKKGKVKMSKRVTNQKENPLEWLNRMGEDD